MQKLTSMDLTNMLGTFNCAKIIFLYYCAKKTISFAFLLPRKPTAAPSVVCNDSHRKSLNCLLFQHLNSLSLNLQIYIIFY
jgi:hypothetical protein